MEKYTIDIYLVDESGFETNTTLYNLSLSQLMKLYALTTVLKFTKKSILIHSQDAPELKTNIVFMSSEKWSTMRMKNGPLSDAFFGLTKTSFF